MSVGDVAGLIAAIAFVLLVGLLAIPLLKLGKVLDEARRLVGSVTDETVPLINEVTTTVGLTNHQLERVDTITAGVQQVTTNVSALTSLFAATLGSPVVKVAAFTYGVRRAMSDRRHDDVEKRVKSELKAEKQEWTPRGWQIIDQHRQERRQQGLRRMKRLFYLAVGAGVGVAAFRRASRAARKLTPAGLAGSAGGAVSGLRGSIRGFVDDVRVGMVEREAQLHEALARRGAAAVSRRPGQDARRTAGRRPRWSQRRSAADGLSSSRQRGHTVVPSASLRGRRS